MTPTGSTSEWVDLLDSQVPDILALVIDTWEAMSPPAANAKEDPVSVSLCLMLQRSPARCELPFQIHSQLVELDPAAGEDQGRMDIVFSLLVPREDIYFCLECKRLNVISSNGVRPYFAEYVRFGMLRFVRGQYSRAVRNGGMLAFVLNGDVPGALNGVEENIRALHEDLHMALPATFLVSSVRPTDARVRETLHVRVFTKEPFMIHHLFMAGELTAPVSPEPTGNVGTMKKRKTMRRTIRR